MLDLVDLHDYAGRSVDELSGGEQQRVALARTLAPSPRLVLLDEPLANLDRQLREELVEDLRAIVKHVGVTTVFVTHDQQEAFALADRLAVMNQGRVEQEGTPQAVHRHPASTFVARFLGFHNLIPAVAEEDHVRTPIGVFHLPPEQMAALRQRPGLLLIRPDAGTLLSGEPPYGAHVLRGRVTGASFRGNVYRVHVAALDDPTLPVLTFELATHATNNLPTIGEPLSLLLDMERMTVVRA